MKYPVVTRLLGGRFHEHWAASGEPWQQVLDRLLQQSNAQELHALLRELEELGAAGICEPQLSDVVHYEIGCYVTPEDEGMDMSTWLSHVSDAVRRRVRALDAAQLDLQFQQAVAAIDRGDAAALRQLLVRHPQLARERLHAPGAWLREQVGTALDDFFQAPYLLWFVAEDPVRRGRLPANIAEIAQNIIDAARVTGARVQEQVDYALRLVAWSSIAREAGVQIALVDVLLAAGASAQGRAEDALVNANFAAAAHLVERGAGLTLPTALMLERWDDVARLGPGSNPETRQFALVLAALHGRAQAVAKMLEFGASVNEPSSQLYAHGTPLHHAVCSGSLATIEVLVHAGAAIDREDTLHRGTPIGWAEYYEEQHTGSQLAQRYAEIAAYLRGRRAVMES
jgi:peptide-methionine (S)-S-oxide reductase